MLEAGKKLVRKIANPTSLIPNLTVESGPFDHDLLDRITPAALLLGGMALAVSDYRSIKYGWDTSIVFNTVLYLTAVLVLFFRRRLPSGMILGLIFFIIFLAATHGFFSFGIVSDGILELAFLCILVVTFRDLTSGMLTLLAGTGIIFAIGSVLDFKGVIHIEDINGYVRDPLNWSTEFLSMTLYLLPSLFIISRLKDNWTTSLNALQQANDRMREEIERRTRTEAELRKREESYRSFFENAAEGIFQISPDGNLTHANAALAQMGGFASVEEMTGGKVNLFDWQRYVDCRDPRRLKEEMDRNGQVKGFETLMRFGEVNMLWVRLNARLVRLEDGRPGHYEGTVENITIRKVAEINQKESEARYRDVVENSLAGFYISKDRKFTFANGQMCRMTGYENDELIGRIGLLDIVHPDDKSDVEKELKKRVTGSTNHVDFEFRIIRKDGQPATVKALSSLIRTKDGQAGFGTMIDITREKTLERQLRQAQKMEAIGTLTGGIAHDFNNILTVITGYGNMMQLNTAADDLQRYYADQVIAAASKASTLTQSLLAFSRKQPVSLEAIDLNRIVRGTQKLLQRLITEDIQLETQLFPEDLVVMADATQIDQILFNLATNARDVMPDGGIIRIETSSFLMDERFLSEKGFGRIRSYSLLSVSDTGSGMDAHTLKRIFDPFFTTKPAGKGTGLGLSTVYGIVKQHDGYITVDSTPGKGTDFRVYLPLVRTKMAYQELPKKTLKNGNETILVAEDDESVRDFIIRLLRHYGYTVVPATDGEDAVEQFRRHDTIDLVVMDSVMPKKSGIEVYEEMQAFGKKVNVVFISGHSRDVVLGKGIREDSLPFLKKPLQPGLLIQMVRDVLDDRWECGPGCP